MDWSRWWIACNVAAALNDCVRHRLLSAETTKYDPTGFDVRKILAEHAAHPEWGKTAAHLLRTKYKKSGRPPSNGHDAGDHPPITPTRVATRDEVGGGSAWRVCALSCRCYLGTRPRPHSPSPNTHVCTCTCLRDNSLWMHTTHLPLPRYRTDEFVARTFIGSLADNLTFTRRIVTLETHGERGDGAAAEQFAYEDTRAESIGFAGACRWVLRDLGLAGKDEGRPSFQEGDFLPVTRASVDRQETQSPRFLQEHELIELMDAHRIGTDASMAVHVSNIVDRGYVVVCDETGVPLRSPRPVRAGSKPLPRQIGRYMVPTPLGIQLIELFGEHHDLPFDATNGEGASPSPALLAQPSIRARMEAEVKQIALGELSKEQVVTDNLSWFQQRYHDLEASLTPQRIGALAKALEPVDVALKRWRRFGAFNPSSSGSSRAR